ncbi:MAG: hypothetical protein K8I82_16585, partial [Anaerolineae bacterium]|nr:hypothetical protein [Anaerolineae bacterium]
TLTDEYWHAVMDCGLSLKQLEDAALNAVRYSYLPAKEKSDLLAEFEAAYPRLRHEHELT